MVTDGLGFTPEEGSGAVLVPAPVIHNLEALDTEEDEVTFYGNFWIFGYEPEGSVMVSVGGGDNPGLMKLAKQDGVWTVTGVRFASDGADQIRDLKEMAGGDEQLLAAFQDASDADGAMSQIRRSFVAEYVNAGGLGVTAFMDPYQEPVSLTD